jgi:hypothetical protein
MFKLYLYLALGAAVVATSGYAIYSIRKGAFDEIDARNVEAAGVANEASMSLAACDARSGVYFFESGKCRWTAPKRRE